MKFFIDCEANSPSNRIIQIGCVAENGQKFNTYVNPKESIAPFIRKLTGINNYTVLSAPTIDIALKKFLQWIEINNKDEIPIFYSYGDDGPYFKNTLKLLNNYTSTICASLIYTNIIDYSEIVREHFSLLRGIGLNKVVNYLKNTDEIQKHDALVDAADLKFVYDNIKDKPKVSGIFPAYEINIDEPFTFSRIKIKNCSSGIVETDFGSMKEIISWLLMKMPKETRERTNIKNLGKKVRNAINTNKPYCGYVWFKD